MTTPQTPTEEKSPIQILWDKMSHEDWLAGEGFKGKYGGLTGVPFIHIQRIFEFAEAYAKSQSNDKVSAIAFGEYLLKSGYKPYQNTHWSKETGIAAFTTECMFGFFETEKCNP